MTRFLSSTLFSQHNKKSTPPTPPSLEEQLQQALAAEDYARCAQLRDQILQELLAHNAGKKLA